MQEDPWAKFRKPGAQPVQQPTAQPVPTPPPQAPAPRLPYSPGKVQAQQNQQKEAERAEARLGIDQNQDARSAEAHGVKMAGITANGGVDTTPSQDQAAGHALNIINNLATLDEVSKDNPEAAKPSLWEVGVEMVTDNPNVMSWATSGNPGRGRAKAALDSSLESIIWLSTGAAVTEPQGIRFKNEITPFYFDDPDTIKWKRAKLMSRIAEARVRAGPANVKIQKALDMLEQKGIKFYDMAFDEAKAEEAAKQGGKQGGKPGQPATSEAPNPWKDKDGFPQRQIGDMIPDAVLKPSDQYEYVEYPSEAVAKHNDWIRQNPNATAQDYLAFRKQLDSEYMFGPDQTLEGQAAEEYDPTEVDAFLQYYRQRPEAPIPPIFGKKRLTAFQKAHNWVAQSEAGNAVANFANARGFGLMEPLLTDKQRKNWHRRNMDSPWISTAADIAGSISPVGALSKAGAKVAGSEAGARVLANTGYGAVRGAAGAQEGERTQGALFGGGLSALGAVGGEAFGSGSRGFSKPKTVENLDQLAGNKDMTLMQRMGLGHAEEGLQGLPIVRGARQKSIEGFNNDNVNRALKNVGAKLPKDTEAGFAANAKMNEILNAAYNRVRPKVVGEFDSAFKMATNGIRNGVMKSGNALKVDLYKELQGVLNTFKGGKYNGNTFKDADQKLRQLGNDWRQVDVGSGVTSPSTYHEMARVADKLRGQLRAQVSRNTPEVAGELKNLDRAWAHAVRIENATNRAKGVYSPDQLKTTIKTLDTSKNRGAFARGQAFDQEYAQAAESILGKVASKETANPLQTTAITHLMTKHPILVGTPLSVAMTASYTPGLKKLIEFLATSKRPKAIEKNFGTIVSQMVRKSQTEKED